MKVILAAVLSLGLFTSVQATPVTMEFSASGFQNAGTQYPGFAGPIQGSLSWTDTVPGGPVDVLTSINLTIAGHSYNLAEVGIASQSTTQTAIGAAGNGFNAVVGSGVFDDFLIVFDRVTPTLQNFAYSIQGKTNAIWWTPTTMSARYVTQQVPEPATVVLALTALGLMVASTRRSGNRAALS